jgi:hypothetical protein
MRQLCAAVLAGCVVVSLPADAHAQLGIGRKIKNAATRAAGGESGGNESVRTGSVRFTNQVLEITESRLAQFLKGLEAEAQMAARIEAQDTEGIERSNQRARDDYDRKYADYQKKSDAWDRCAKPIEERSSSQRMQGLERS